MDRLYCIITIQVDIYFNVLYLLHVGLGECLKKMVMKITVRYLLE